MLKILQKLHRSHYLNNFRNTCLSSLFQIFPRSILDGRNQRKKPHIHSFRYAAQIRQPIENSLVLSHMKTLRLYTGFSSLSLTITLQT